MNPFEKKKTFLQSFISNNFNASKHLSSFKYVNSTVYAAQAHPNTIFSSTTLSLPKPCIKQESNLLRSFSENDVSYCPKSTHILPCILDKHSEISKNKCPEQNPKILKRCSILKRSSSLSRTKPIIIKKVKNQPLFNDSLKKHCNNFLKTTKQKLKSLTNQNIVKPPAQKNSNKQERVNNTKKITNEAFENNKTKIKFKQLQNLWPFLKTKCDNNKNFAKFDKKSTTNERHKLTKKTSLVHRLSSRLIRIYLPGSQTSAVVAKPGQTVSSTLKKSLTRHGLKSDNCVVETKDNGQLVDWESDIELFIGQELIVINIFENDYSPPRISHSIVQVKFSPSSCVYCSKYILNGLTCSRCCIRFHDKCAENVEKEMAPCKPTLTTENNLICHLLAQNNKQLKNCRQNGLNTNREETLSSNMSTKQIQIQYQKEKKTVFSESQSNKNLKQFRKSQKLKHFYNKNKFEPLLATISENENDKKVPSQTDNSVIQNQNVNFEKKLVTKQNNCENEKYCFDSVVTFEDNSSKDDWIIEWKQIKKEKLVGAGTFGEVFQGNWHGPIAIKMLKYSNPNDEQTKDFQNEINILRKTRHFNIVLFMGYCIEPLAIVMQWCDGQSLYRHLHVNETNLEMLQILKISQQITDGMDYLHSKRILHRDLKSNNVFLTKNLNAKIGDFGLSTIKMSSETDSKQYIYPTGSVLWMAPEIMRAGSNSIDPYTNKSDVYAFGIVLYELNTGLLPFPNLCPEMIIYNVGRGNPIGKLKLTNIREDAPKDFIDLLVQCTEFNHESRPDFKKIHQIIQIIGKKYPKVNRSTSMPMYKTGTDDFEKYAKFFDSKNKFCGF